MSPVLDADHIERLLDTWPVARLATLAEGGRPHLVPIVFARAAGALWSPVDGKPKSSHRLARLAHVAADRRVCLLLDDYDADWARLWWIRIDAAAAVTSGSAEAETALRAKYPQYRDTPLHAGPPTWIRIVPIEVVSWSATPR